MKTTDLIPLILYNLAESDKYGFELSKSIENLSNGKIIIKQATLYTILKKLEKSKFISSYWQDSEIGGKRHYYKLTQNGNLQLSTMPRIEVILDNIIQNLTEEDLTENNDVDEKIEAKNNDFQTYETKNSSNQNIYSTSLTNEEHQEIEQSNIQQKEEQLKIEYVDSEQQTFENSNSQNKLDKEKETETAVLKESIIPSSEVFSSTEIDNLTETEINQSNLELLRNETEVKSEQFATNKNVSKFLENKPAPVDSNYFTPSTQHKINEEFLKPESYNHYENEEIKYVDYVNFKQNPKYLNSRKTARNMLLKVLSSTSYLILTLIITAIATQFTGRSIIYYIFLIVGIIVAIFYPVIYLLNYDKFRLKCQSKGFKNDIKKHSIILTSIFLITLVALIIINISLDINSIKKLFEIKNFANIYAPIIIASTLLIDLLFDFVIMCKKNKN